MREVPPLRGLTQKLLTFLTLIMITLKNTPNGHFFIFARGAEACPLFLHITD